jgi:hypothetical protein
MSIHKLLEAARRDQEVRAQAIREHVAKTGRPDQQTIRQVLDDVEAVTKGRFYEDPDPIASPVEMFKMPDGKPGGEPFAELSVREQVQVLGDYTRWREYERNGICSEQLDQIFWNVIQRKPREQWLEGSGLSQPTSARRDDASWLPEPEPTKQQEQERGREM